MKKGTVLNTVFSILVFMTLNIPSLKILYSSPLINICVFVCIWIVGIFRTTSLDNSLLTYTKIRMNFIILFIIMWLIIIGVTLIKSPVAMGVFEYSQYIITPLMVIGIALFLKREDIPKVFYLQVVWGLLLSSINLTVGLKLNSSLGQHYLTAGVPIAAGIIITFGLLFYKKSKKTIKVFLFIVLAISLLGVVSLSGRTPVVLSIGVPTLTILLMILIEKNVFRKLKTLIISIITIPIIFVLVRNNLSDQLLYRFKNLSYKENDRSFLYDFTLTLIKNNPFGLGLMSSFDYGFNYPHNIFLEIGMTGGILALSLFIIIIFLVLGRGMRTLRVKNFPLISMNVTLFFLLTWCVSFDLSSSYIPFTAIVMLFVATEKNKPIFKR